MSRITLAWELGANLGHIDRLLPVARVLRARGHDVVFVLRDLSRAHPRIAAEGFRLGQAPVWLPRMVNPPQFLNYSMALASAGWLDAPGLAGLLAGWQTWYDLLQPDAVICDFAPTAVLAARERGMTVWTLGSSFERPPAGPYFPPMAYWEPSHAAQCAAHDATVLPHVNRALALRGMAPLPNLAELFDGTRCALATLPALAHYGTQGLDADVCGPLYRDDGGVAPQWPAGDGPRVFVYLSPSHAEFRPLLDALRAEKRVALVLARGLSVEAAARLAGPQLRLEAEPLHMQQVMAQADLVVSHGGMGTTSAALLAGRPQLLLPTHMEQAMVGRRVADAGLGIVLPVRPTARPGEPAPRVPATDWRRLLRRLLTEPDWATTAQAAAARDAGASPAATAERVADRVEASLRGA